MTPVSPSPCNMSLFTNQAIVFIELQISAISRNNESPNTTIEFWYSIPTIIILIGIQSGHNYCRNTVGLWSHLALMQSEYSRSHLLKAYARQCANTVGIQAESTNREIDYDVMNDIVLIVIWHYCRNAVRRLHSDYFTSVSSRNAVDRLYSDRNNGQFVCR